MSTISCALIVRDAESTLARALQSVQGHVDEIVVVDTGSVDQTRHVAWRFTDNVREFAWEDHFARARQYAHDLCTGEWVFFLDADDEVINAAALRSCVDGAPESMDAYMIRYCTERNSEGQATTEFYRERLVRKDRMHWEGRVHEVMVPNGAQCAYERFDSTWVQHHGHGDPAGSLVRNIRLLRMDLAERPGETRTMFYLGRDLVQTGQLEEGRELLETYLTTALWPDERFHALIMIGHALRLQAKYADAYASDVRLLVEHALWPHAWFLLAQDCYFLARWPESATFCQIGQELPPAVSNLFTSPATMESSWMIYQSVALYYCGRLQEAHTLTKRALELLPNDLQHQANLIYFERKLTESAATQVATVARCN